MSIPAVRPPEAGAEAQPIRARLPNGDASGFAPRAGIAAVKRPPPASSPPTRHRRAGHGCLRSTGAGSTRPCLDVTPRPSTSERPATSAAPVAHLAYSPRMPEVKTSIAIAAAPERVWAILTDFADYPRWNRMMPRVHAELREGGEVRFRLKIEGAPELGIAAKIVRHEPGRALAWRGGAPLVPALAWGEHYFEVTPAAGGVTFTHGERFGGLLDLLVRGSTHARVTRTYDAFNAALKARAEA